MTAVQPFYIPSKVTEQEEVCSITPPGDERLSLDTVIDPAAMDSRLRKKTAFGFLQCH